MGAEQRLRPRRGIGILRWVLSENGTTTVDRGDYPEERKELSLGNAEGIWADINPCGRPDLSRGRLEKVKCPVTRLVGDMGQRWFRKSADALVGMLPDAHLETIAGTNHALTFHQPERFAEAITRPQGDSQRADFEGRRERRSRALGGRGSLVNARALA